PADIAGDPAGGVVSLGDGGEHRMIKRRVADLGFLGEEVPGFPEQRGLRVQHRPDHPRVEVGEVRGGVSAQEFPPVGGVPPTTECTSAASLGSVISQNRAASRYPKGWTTSSRLARPRSGACPESSPPI